MKCANCNKELTPQMEIEYSAWLTEYYCGPDCAIDRYFARMESTPVPFGHWENFKLPPELPPVLVSNPSTDPVKLRLSFAQYQILRQAYEAILRYQDAGVTAALGVLVPNKETLDCICALPLLLGAPSRYAPAIAGLLLRPTSPPITKGIANWFSLTSFGALIMRKWYIYNSAGRYVNLTSVVVPVPPNGTPMEVQCPQCGRWNKLSRWILTDHFLSCPGCSTVHSQLAPIL